MAESRVQYGAPDGKEHRLARAFLPAPEAGWLVIGYGNPLRGDDGFGWHVAERLLEIQHEQLEVIACHQLTPELAEPLAHAARAVFVDASLNLPPGALVVRELEPDASSLSSTHHLQPTHLLALARRLYGHSPQALMISVGVLSLEHAEHLSPEVATVMPAVLEIIHERSCQKHEIPTDD